jgi:hypothetical protein
MKTLRELLESNMKYVEGSYKTSASTQHIQGHHLVGEFSQSRLFWKYVDDPTAVVAFGKVFGGFIVILKTPRGMSGYSMLDNGGHLKCVFVMPTVIAECIKEKTVDVMQLSPDLDKLLANYIVGGGEFIGEMTKIGIERTYLDGSTRQSVNVVGMTGQEILNQSDTWVQKGSLDSYNVLDYHLCRSKSGNIHIASLDAGYHRTGWYVESSPMRTLGMRKGPSLYAGFEMHKCIFVGLTDVVRQKQMDDLPTQTYVDILICKTPSVLIEFLAACQDAVVRSTLKELKKRDRYG